MKRTYIKDFLFVGALIVAAGCSNYQSASTTHTQASALAYRLAGTQTASGEESTFVLPPLEKGVAGKYLASHFAQSKHNWETANNYLGAIISTDPENAELIRRSMILAVGSGDMDVAVTRARALLDLETGDESLPLMIIAIHQMTKGQMQDAINSLDLMPEGDMTDFVKPILKGWAKAAEGEYDTASFNETTIHHYHGAVIASFLGNDEEMKRYTDNLMAAGTLSNIDAERAADLLALQGRFEDATILYEGVYMQGGGTNELEDKIAAAKQSDPDKIKDLSGPTNVKNVGQGAALALYDMAYILYHEHSDSSTKLFANMALALDPNLTDAHLLLADTLSRNGQIESAILQISNVQPNHPSFLAVQRHAAELLAEVGRKDEALEKLNSLFIEYNDVESLIRIGDLHRNGENYKNALTAYNKAFKYIGETIPEEYWYLLYARGMAYEREGDWQKAETDLKAALVFRPDHPYLLNYLGYGWADQGQNLEESLELIKRAAALRPRDGYIIDSLGWVHYMAGNFKEALPHLERAVELLPYDSTINDHLGDAYWRVGRRTEARFQWERALNYNEDDPALSKKLDDKLRFGLQAVETTKHADTAE